MREAEPRAIKKHERPARTFEVLRSYVRLFQKVER